VLTPPVLLAPPQTASPSTPPPPPVPNVTMPNINMTTVNMTSADPTIIDVAMEFTPGEFNTLIGFIQRAGLADTLNGIEPLTLFAPTDAAFQRLGGATVSSLLGSVDLLREFLLYHVVAGTVLEANLAPGMLQTMQGDDISISTLGGGDELVLNGEAGLEQADIAASNGVIHMIDEVLIPPSLLTPSPTSAPSVPLVSLLDTAVGRGDFSTLLGIVQSTNLTDLLIGSELVTIFAPTDAAFSQLGDTISSLPLREVMLYHMVSGDVPSRLLFPGGRVRTLQGENITVNVVDRGVTLNDGVGFVDFDILASNGIIHIIDNVLIPPSVAAP